MHEADWLAGRFEENRGHLRAVAYRMLGSLHEAEDAVQEAWLRLNRSDTSDVENLGGWLTTVVARICLDMLRLRKSRSEEPLGEGPTEARKPEPIPGRKEDPEQEALMAESVGLALLVVLDKLAPAERIAFVLHDIFAVPFEEIAAIAGRTPSAARQLASRARRRVQGTPIAVDPDRTGHRKIVESFLAALRSGDFDALVSVLDPKLVVRADATAQPTEALREIRGAQAWAKSAVGYSKGARFAQTALVDGAVGVIVAPHGRLLRVLRLTITHDKIAQIEVIGEPGRLRDLNLAIPG